MAAAAAEVSSPGDHPILRDDERGTPRSLRLLAALVEANALRYPAAASGLAESDLIRAFRGGAAPTPTVSISEFLERVQQFIRLESVRHDIRLEGTSYVLAGIYLTRFMRSPAALEAGILVEPTTAWPSRSSWAPSSAAPTTPSPRGGPSSSRSARTLRSARARWLTSRSGSCAPSTSASSSTARNSSGSAVSWSRRRRRRGRAAAAARGRRRRRWRAKGWKPAASHRRRLLGSGFEFTILHSISINCACLLSSACSCLLIFCRYKEVGDGNPRVLRMASSLVEKRTSSKSNQVLEL